MTRAAASALRVGLTLALAAAHAPRVEAQGHIPKQWLYAAGGAAFGLGVTAIYSTGRYNQSLGWCSSSTCVGVFTTVASTTVGYLIGHEIEQKHRYQYRAAPPMDLPNRSRVLRTRATGLAVGGRLVAVSGDDGVELVTTGPALDYLGHRARGLRDIADVGVAADQPNLLIGTGTGLYVFGISGEAGGTRAGGGGGAVSAVAMRGSRVAVAGAGALRIGTVSPGGDSITWRADTSALAARVADLRWQSDSLLWVLTESVLSAFRVSARGDAAPVALGAVTLDGPARRLAVGDSVVVVAAGAEGVTLVRTADPGQLRVVARWTSPRYIYDVALWGGRVYAAGGPEGLYVLRPSPAGDRLEAVGLARNVGFVAALATTDEALYVLDRTGGVLRRIEPAPSAASPPPSPRK